MHLWKKIKGGEAGMSTSRLWKMTLGFVAVIIFLGFTWLSNCMDPQAPENLVQYNTFFYDCTSHVSKYMTSKYYDNIQLVESIEETADIVITTNSEYNLDNFTNENIGYSPIVALFPERMIKIDNKNFSTLSNSSSKVYYMTNMEQVLDAFIKSDTGKINTKDLGYHDELTDITLSIPDNGCYYRKDVVNSLIYILSDGKDITEENAAEIRDKLTLILSKANNVKNPIELLVDNKNTILILPEYILAEKSNIYYPIYWNNCYAIPLNMHINSTIESDCTDLIKTIRTDKDMFYNNLFRNQVKPNRSNNLSYTADSISVIYGQNNLESLLGENYWK